MKLTPEAAQALTNLRASADFKAFLGWLKERSEQQIALCKAADGTTLFRAQGAAKAIDDIFDAFSEAPEIVERVKRNQRNTP